MRRSTRCLTRFWCDSHWNNAQVFHPFPHLRYRGIWSKHGFYFSSTAAIVDPTVPECEPDSAIVETGTAKTVLEPESSNAAAFYRFQQMLREKKFLEAGKIFEAELAATATLSQWASALTYTLAIDERLGLKLFELTKSSPTQPDAVVYGVVIHYFAQKGASITAMKYCSEMKKNGVEVTVHIYNSLINAWANATTHKESAVEECEQLFSQISQQGLQMDVYTITAMMKMFAGTNNREKFRAYFDKLGVFKVKPTLSFFNIVINMSTRWGTDEVLWYFNAMSAAQIEPDVDTMNTLLSVFSEPEFEDELKLIYDQIFKRGLSPNLRTFSTMLHFCAKAGNTDGLTGYLNDMENNGLRANIVIFNTVLKAYGDIGNIAMMRVFMDCMKARNIRKDTFTYSIILHALMKAKQISHMERIWTEMAKNQISPTMQMYNSMLRGWASTGDSAKVKKYYSAFRKAGFEPGLATHFALIEVEAVSGNIEAMNKHVAIARPLISKMSTAPEVPDIFACRIRAHCVTVTKLNATEVEAEVTAIYNEMTRLGVSPNASIFNEMFCLFAHTDNLGRILSSLRMMQQVYPNRLKENITDTTLEEIRAVMLRHSPASNPELRQLFAPPGSEYNSG